MSSQRPDHPSTRAGPHAARKTADAVPIAFAEAGSGLGGSAQSLLRILAALRRDAPDRLAPTVLCAHQAGVELFRGHGFTAQRIHGSGLVARYREMRRLLAATGARVLHCNNPPYDHIPHILAARRSGVPVTVHYRVGRVLSRAERAVLALVSHVFAVSERGAQAVRDQGWIAPGRVTRLDDGVDLDAYTGGPEARSAARAALDLDERNFVLLLPATLQPGKGQDVAVDAAHMLARSDRDTCAGRAVWLFAGGEHYQAPGWRAVLEARIRDQGLAGEVHLLGHREDMPALLAAADAVALPSELTEGTPCAILEAFAAGRPVVAARTGAVPEAVDAQVGALVPPGDAAALADAVARLWQDTQLRARLGAAARARAQERYDVRRIAARLADTLVDLARA